MLLNIKNLWKFVEEHLSSMCLEYKTLNDISEVPSCDCCFVINFNNLDIRFKYMYM